MKLGPLAAVCLSVVMLLILKKQNHTEWDPVFVILLILEICSYFVIYYVEQYKHFLTVNSSSAGHIPAKAMFHSGMGLILGYTGIGFLLMILIANVDWLKYVFHLLKALLVSFIQWFFGLFPRGNNDESGVYEDQSLEMMEDMMPMEGLGESFWLWDVLESVLVVVIFAGVIFFAVKGILFLVKFIRSKLQGIAFKQDDAVKEDAYDVREKCDIVRDSSWTRKLPFLSADPRERIRHLYKKRLLASQRAFTEADGDKSLLNRLTARESSRILEREQLAFIYEKARYSNVDCSSEDVKQMKEACK